MSYGVRTARHFYQFTRDRHDFSEWSDFGDATAISDVARTVSIWDLDDSIGVAFGRGTSENPDRAEAYLYLDAKDDADAAISGRYRLVVLNASNDVMGVIAQGPLDEVRDGDPSGDRGSWGIPFPYRSLKNGKGEVIGAGGYKIGLQVKTNSGTATFSTANSKLVAEGFRGQRQD